MIRIDYRCAFVEQFLDISGETIDQRDLDKNQRLVRHSRMKKRKTSAIGIEPVLQIIPAPNFMHRFIGDKLLEKTSGRIPFDLLQLEEPNIEPGSQQLP